MPLAFGAGAFFDAATVLGEGDALGVAGAVVAGGFVTAGAGAFLPRGAGLGVAVGAKPGSGVGGAMHGGATRSTTGWPGFDGGAGVGVLGGSAPATGQGCASVYQCSVKPSLVASAICLLKYVFGNRLRIVWIYCQASSCCACTYTLRSARTPRYSCARDPDPSDTWPTTSPALRRRS